MPQTDWSSIPDDILTSIAGKIVSVDDYVSFSAVCRYWYSLAADHHNHPKPQFQPLFTPGINPGSKTIKFRNPTSGKTLTADLPPEIAGTTRFWGSPFGWLIACGRTRHILRLSLFNPFTGATIPLPNYSYSDTDTDRLPNKFNVFLTANPSDPKNCLVVLHPGEGRNVNFLRLDRDIKRWCSTHLYDIDDFTYFNGTLYGVRYYRYISWLNPHNDDDDILTQSLNNKPFSRVMGHPCRTQTHVFILNGELCLCVRRLYFNLIKAEEDIRIFRIDPSNGDLTPVTSLGDKCLFLGSNYSFACKASYPLAQLSGDHEGEELVSDLVFFSYRNGIRVYIPSPLSETLWIVPSLTMFRKLEDISTRPIVTPKQ